MNKYLYAIKTINPHDTYNIVHTVQHSENL